VHVSAGSPVDPIYQDDASNYGLFYDADLEHVFNVIGFSFPVREFFVGKCGLNTLARFAHNPPTVFEHLVNDPNESLRIGDLQDYFRFYNFFHQKFFPQYRDRFSTQAIRDTFTPGVWAECYTLFSGTSISSPDTASTPGPFPTTAELPTPRATSVSTRGRVDVAVEPEVLEEEPEVLDVVAAPPAVDLANHQDYSSGASPFRVDIKLFPTLKNLTTITGTPFLRWRNRFQSMARLTKTIAVLKTEVEHPTPAPSDPIYPTYMAQDAFILTALLHATEGTNAAAYVENQATGRAAWHCLINNYQGKGGEAETAAEASAAMHSLEFGERPGCSMETFLSKLDLYFQIMEDNGLPLNSTQKCELLLQKITHSAFLPLLPIFRHDNQPQYEGLKLALMQEARRLNLKLQRPGGGDRGPKRINKFKGGGKSAKSNGKDKAGGGENKTKALQEALSYAERGEYIPRKVWAQLDRDNQIRVKELAKGKKTRAVGSTPPSLPLQYGGQVHMTGGYFPVPPASHFSYMPQTGMVYPGLYGPTSSFGSTSSSTTTTPTSNTQLTAQQRAHYMIQQAHPPTHLSQSPSPHTAFQANIMRGHLTPSTAPTSMPTHGIPSNLCISASPLMKQVYSSKTMAPLEGYQATTMVDGGCNMACSGRNFRVLEFSLQKVDLQFAGGGTADNIPLVSSVTLPLQPDGTPLPYLLGIHNAAHMPSSEVSLLCPHQIREHGIFCCDVNVRHGGSSMIAGPTGQPHLLLTPQEALLQLQSRYPTIDELDTLPIHWVTSDLPWDPRSVDSFDNIRIVPSIPSEVGSRPFHSVDSTIDIPGFAFLQSLRRTLHSFAFHSCPTGFIGSYHMIFRSTGTPSTIDYQSSRSRLGWLPLDTIRRTFECTTQLAKSVPDSCIKSPSPR
jgi:hypothetical protein